MKYRETLGELEKLKDLLLSYLDYETSSYSVLEVYNLFSGYESILERRGYHFS